MNKFLKIFQVLIFLSIVFLLSVNIVLAAIDPPKLSVGSDVLGLSQKDFGSPCRAGSEEGICEIDWIGTYIAGIYRYGISLAAVLAVVMVMVGGFIWLSSGGSADRIKTAKNYIGSAFAGLLLALFAFVILNTINPRLVNLDPLKIQSIREVEIPETEVDDGLIFSGLLTDGKHCSGPDMDASCASGVCLTFWGNECGEPLSEGEWGCKRDNECEGESLLCILNPLRYYCGSNLPRGAWCRRPQECASETCGFSLINECD